MDVLEAALKSRPEDARAHYYLGNLLYELQPDRAVTHWEKACHLEPTLAVAHRNLGWAYLRHRQDPARAISSYETAIQHNPNDPRYYLELDDLYERSAVSPRTRLAMLERNPRVTALRKDLLIRQIRLLIATGDTSRAGELLAQNRFFISEGGGRELGDAYVDAQLLRGLQQLQAGQADQARGLFRSATAYPENLSQESPRNERRMPQMQYLLARAEQRLRNETEARNLFEQVTNSRGSRSREAQFYEALAYRALGQEDRTRRIAEGLVSWAAEQLVGEVETDVFAKFGERQTLEEQRAEAHYVRGLGLLLLGREEEAVRDFEQALARNPAHVWAGYFVAAGRAP